GKIKNNDYFAAIDAEMNNGGREALLYHLLNFDLSQVKLREIPHTAALFEQIVDSATPEQAWWLDTLKRGELPKGTDEKDSCPKRLLFRSIETTLGMFLIKYVGNDLISKRKDYTIRFRSGSAGFHGGGGRTENGWVYTFPSLPECRKKFAKEMNQTIAW